MVFQVNWTGTSAVSYGNNIDYVRTKLGEAEVKKFKDEVIKRLEVLATQPFLGIAKMRGN